MYQENSYMEMHLSIFMRFLEDSRFLYYVAISITTNFHERVIEGISRTITYVLS